MRATACYDPFNGGRRGSVCKPCARRHRTSLCTCTSASAAPPPGAHACTPPPAWPQGPRRTRWRSVGGVVAQVLCSSASGRHTRPTPPLSPSPLPFGLLLPRRPPSRRRRRPHLRPVIATHAPAGRACFFCRVPQTSQGHPRGTADIRWRGSGCCASRPPFSGRAHLLLVRVGSHTGAGLQFRWPALLPRHQRSRGHGLHAPAPAPAAPAAVLTTTPALPSSTT